VGGGGVGGRNRGTPGGLLGGGVGGDGEGGGSAGGGNGGIPGGLLGEGAVELRCDPRTEARSFNWTGDSIQSLTSGYAGNATFTLVTCAASRFSPLGIPGTGGIYYRLAVAPAFPAGRADVRRLQDGATHLVVAEKPALVAQMIADELRAHLRLG